MSGYLARFDIFNSLRAEMCGNNALHGFKISRIHSQRHIQYSTSPTPQVKTNFLKANFVFNPKRTA